VPSGNHSCVFLVFCQHRKHQFLVPWREVGSYLVQDKLIVAFGELCAVALHVRERVFICIGKDKLKVVGGDYGSDEKIICTVVVGNFIDVQKFLIRFQQRAPFKEFSSSEALQKL